MNSFCFPSVFLSHGTPMHAFGGHAYENDLNRFSASLPKPKAIVILSAHSVSSRSIHISKNTKNKIHYDFSGFPPELYEIQYSCPGDLELSDEVATILNQNGFETHLEPNASLDHGVWIPLQFLYPKGDVPVVRISLPIDLLPAQILKIGHSLSSLRKKGVLLISSGGAVHNLKTIQWSKKNEEGAAWAKEFEDWIISALQHKNVEALLHVDQQPLFNKAHPSTEHFLPILFTIGAALTGDSVEVFHRGIEYDTLSLLCFSLNHDQKQTLH